MFSPETYLNILKNYNFSCLEEVKKLSLINKMFYGLVKSIHDDRDKDIIAKKEDIETLISCKFRNKRNIRFDDVKRTVIISNYYDIQDVIVTNCDYSKKATKAASEYDVILSYQSNLKHRLNYYIEKELDEKELDILCDILNLEDY
ncbi:8020_t:CDS:2 [Cetraspora pellucida]|uniref:8020_t:CDS:1 n=1 Tax=Cetraspora pellucida TaxID=1433469 RepID=A0ACA9LMC8_9GLOM|nr:8020_t:CDS:2 [Cetraspora pellucida]